MCVLALHLAKELCRTDEDGEHWVSVMRKIPVLPSVLNGVELSLRSKHNLYFTEAALHLLLTLARTPQVNTHLACGCWRYPFHLLADWSSGYVLLHYFCNFLKQLVVLRKCYIDGVSVCPPGGSSCCRSRRHPDYLPPSSGCLWGIFKWCITGIYNKMAAIYLQNYPLHFI